MGYYSDVRIITTQKGYKILQKRVETLIAKEVLAGKKVYDLLKTLDIAKINPVQNYVILGWDQIKWYDDEPEIEVINEALDYIAHEKEIPVRFLRIGEDPTDIEQWDIDEEGVLPEMYPSVSIKIYADDTNERDLKLLLFARDCMVQSIEIADM